MKNICHNFYRKIIFNASALLIHKYANVYSLYSACPFYNLLFKYYLITSLAWLDFIIV